MDSDIYIIPIGDVDEKYLYPLIPKLEKRFTTKVYLALDKRLPGPDYAYDYDAKQYAAMYILTELNKVEVLDGAKILAVTNVDLFTPESGRPFIFGQAIFGKSAKAAVISMLRMDGIVKDKMKTNTETQRTRRFMGEGEQKFNFFLILRASVSLWFLQILQCRMDPKSYEGGKPNDELLIQRMIKEAIHELGHVFGLQNCGEPECVMYLPRDLKELDKKSDSFCLNCQKAFRASKQPKKDK